MRPSRVLILTAVGALALAGCAPVDEAGRSDWHGGEWLSDGGQGTSGRGGPVLRQPDSGNC